MGVRAIAAIAASALAAAAACSTFSSTTDAPSDAGSSEGGTPPPVDPPPADAMPDGQAANDAASDADAAIIKQDFESGGATCAPWTAGSRQMGVAHSGTAFCHVCSASPTQNGYFALSIPGNGAGTYAASVWASTDDDGGVASVELFAFQSGVFVGTVAVGMDVTLTADGGYAPVTTSGTSDGGLDSLKLQLSVEAGHCLDFDDVEVDFFP